MHTETSYGLVSGPQRNMHMVQREMRERERERLQREIGRQRPDPFMTPVFWYAVRHTSSTPDVAGLRFMTTCPTPSVRTPGIVQWSSAPECLDRSLPLLLPPEAAKNCGEPACTCRLALDVETLHHRSSNSSLRVQSALRTYRWE